MIADRARPRSSRWPVLLALAIGLAIGLGAAVLLGGGGDEPPPLPTAVGSETRDGDAEAGAELPTPDDPIDPADATDPEAALRGFLATEVSGDWEASYAFLTPALRESAYTSAASWVNAHADVPRVTGYRVDDVVVDEDAGTATIRTLTGFDPVLDPVLGLVAARGRTDWSLQRTEDGLWRVDTGATTNQMLYPGSEGAATAAASWVEARVACADTGDLEARLLGSPSLGDALCDQGDVSVGEVGPLTDSAAVAPLLSAFGPEVFAWARAVRVQAETPFTLVLGPVGQDWQVVALLP